MKVVFLVALFTLVASSGATNPGFTVVLKHNPSKIQELQNYVIDISKLMKPLNLLLVSVLYVYRCSYVRVWPYRNYFVFYDSSLNNNYIHQNHMNHYLYFYKNMSPYTLCMSFFQRSIFFNSIISSSDTG